MITHLDIPLPEPWQAIDTLDTSELATSECPTEQISITIYQRGSRQVFGWKAVVQGTTIWTNEHGYHETREMAEFEARAVVGYYVKHQRLPDVMEYTMEEGKPPRLDYLGPSRPKKDKVLHKRTIKGGKVYE